MHTKDKVAATYCSSVLLAIVIARTEFCIHLGYKNDWQGRFCYCMLGKTFSYEQLLPVQGLFLKALHDTELNTSTVYPGTQNNPVFCHCGSSLVAVLRELIFLHHLDEVWFRFIVFPTKLHCLCWKCLYFITILLLCLLMLFKDSLPLFRKLVHLQSDHAVFICYALLLWSCFLWIFPYGGCAKACRYFYLFLYYFSIARLIGHFDCRHTLPFKYLTIFKCFSCNKRNCTPSSFLLANNKSRSYVVCSFDKLEWTGTSSAHLWRSFALFSTCLSCRQGCRPIFQLQLDLCQWTSASIFWRLTVQLFSLLHAVFKIMPMAKSVNIKSLHSDISLSKPDFQAHPLFYF